MVHITYGIAFRKDGQNAEIIEQKEMTSSGAVAMLWFLGG